MKQAKRKSSKAGSGILLLAMLVFAAGTVFFGWKTINYFMDSNKSRSYWADVQRSAILLSTAEQSVSTAEPGKEPEEPDGVPAAIDFDVLRALSEDVVAWITVPGTNINYLVAQSEDNDYYLRRLLDGSYANGGTLFMDYRCAADLSDWNTVIYGHHMKDGSMFGALVDYSEQEFFEEHPVMYLYLPGKRYKLEPVAGCYVEADDEIYALPVSREEKDELLEKAVENSTFVSTVTADTWDRLVTLSTCSDAAGSSRYVVLARIAE